jgi:hypothetical protein
MQTFGDRRSAVPILDAVRPTEDGRALLGCCRQCGRWRRVPMETPSPRCPVCVATDTACDIDDEKE